MLSMMLSLLMFLIPVAQQPNAELLYEVRVPDTLTAGKRQNFRPCVLRRPHHPSAELRRSDQARLQSKEYNVLLRSPSSRCRSIRHLRILRTSLRTVEVLSGGTTSIGTFTIVDTIKSGDVFEEVIDKVSNADVDRYVTPFGKKTITMKLGASSQSLSIVGQSVIMTRGAKTTRIDTPWPAHRRCLQFQVPGRQARHDHSPLIRERNHTAAL